MFVSVYRILLMCFSGVSVVVFTISDAYPDGAASSACDSMTPFHRYTAQTRLPPFAVNVSSKTYTPGDKINVTLYAPCGKVQFKGFMLQARRVPDNPERIERLGSFSLAPETHYVSRCGTKGQAVTHDINTPKSSLQFEWSSPVDSGGHVVILATVVQHINIFWVKIASVVIEDETVEDPVNVSLYPTPSLDCTLFDRPTARDSDCGNNQQCFAECNNFFCDASVEWSKVPDGDLLLFHVSVVVDNEDNHWVAIGFSDDANVGNDSVVECVSTNNYTMVYTSYLTNLSSLYNATDVTLEGNLTLKDGVFRCSFLRPYHIDDNPFFYDLSEEWHIIVLSGRISDNSTGMEKEWPNKTIISDQKFRFWRGDIDETGTTEGKLTKRTTPRSSASCISRLSLLAEVTISVLFLNCKASIHS